MILKLTPAQATVAKDKHRFKVLNCGRRFGKTTLCIEEIKGKLAAGKKHIAYIAPTYQQARDIAWEYLKKELENAYFNEARLEIRIGEAIVILRGWEAIETLRGQAFDFIVIDEVAMMRDFWANWQEVLRPTLTDTKGKVMFASTPKGFNHFYDLCNLELTDNDFKSFHFTSYDNTHLPVDELNSAKASLPADRFAQEYLASFQKTQGLVYKEFSRENHLYETLPTPFMGYSEKIGSYQRLGAVDFGYRNPAAVLEVYFDGENLYVDDEWYKTERTDIQIADYVAACKFQAVYPDPENQGAIEELRRKNVNVREVVKGRGSVKSGIQTVRELLLRNALFINRKCVNLISEFEMYSYDNEQSEKNENEDPIKANDHGLDALRYLVSSLLPLITRKEMLRSLPYQDQTPRANPAR